jgi:hypothetical protein
MALPRKTKNLDSVPEAHRSLYEKQGDEYVLNLDGDDPGEDVGALKRALERERENARKLKDKFGNLKDDDLTEFQRLRSEEQQRKEGKLKEEGKWDELRAQLKAEHDTELAALRKQLASRDGLIQELTVVNELRGALANVLPEYREAVEAVLMKKGPRSGSRRPAHQGVRGEVAGVTRRQAVPAITEQAGRRCPRDRWGQGAERCSGREEVGRHDAGREGGVHGREVRSGRGRVTHAAGSSAASVTRRSVE